MNKPLQNLRVIDASSVLAGPAVGTFLAELGADVLKIEHPRGDVTRSWKIPGEPGESVSAYFSSVNYLKKYQVLDLSSSEGHSDFMDLIRSADILLTNFKKGDAEKFGIEDVKLHAINPRLIIGKINGYGDESDRVAYDLILQAESGLMSMNGTPESGPLKMPIALIDILAAHHLKEGILLALYEREKSQKGTSVSASLYDAAISSLTNQASNYLMNGHVPQRIGSLHPNIAPYGELFQTKDGATVTFAIGSDAHFEKLCKTLHLDELLRDQRFKSNQLRVEHREALFALLANSVAKFQVAELLEALRRLNVPAGKVQHLQDVFASPKATSLIRTELIDGTETKRITSYVFK